ncbi:anti-sigma factor [uncultured Oscillibacter sp.]|uniref:anti-sigma factor family protein n=1 Tax=uncultured Oscillibacter sp. TaxID=876091 RepID=UPI00260A93CA|nr:zf-HC2 domain-containing protein [uncultured Oscillibacter sp.]
MTYCEEFAALLDPYIDGELSPAETARVREHLRTCDGCRAYVQAALAMRDAFPEAENTPVPDGFAAGVMAAIRADAAPRKRRRPRWAKTLLPLAACCAIVVLAVSGLPRPSDTAVADNLESQAEIAAPAEAAAPDADSSEEDTAATAYAAQSGEDTADVPDSTVTATDLPKTDAAAPHAQEQPSLTTDPKISIVPREGTSAEEAVPETAPATFAVQSPSLTLTAEEAGNLLDSYTPASESDGALVYELTAAEYTTLLQQLEQQGLVVAGAATAEEAEAAGTVLVHVIPG